MKFYGQWDPPVDKFLLDNYFPNKVNGIFLECGAFDGVTESCCKFFEEFKGWTGINVEPVPYLYRKLCQNRPDATNIHAALTDSATAAAGSAVLRQAVHPNLGNDFGNGSLGHTKAHLLHLEEMGCVLEDLLVPTMTYRQLVAQQQLTHIDLFVLDIEGHELSVLTDMNGCDVLPSIFCIEHGHVNNELYSAVQALGYRFDKTSFNNAFFTKA